MQDITQDQPTASPDADAAQSMGQFLKQERLRQNKTLKEVAEATCIHINTIEALEEENRRKLPAEVFVRGFISIYAQHLRLDPQDALNRYGRKMTAEWVSPGTGFDKRKVLPPKTAPRPPAAGRRWLVAFGVVVAVLLGFWGYRQVLPPVADRPTDMAHEEAVLPFDSTTAGPEIERAEDQFAESWEAVAEATAQEEETTARLLVRSEKTGAERPAEPAGRDEVALPSPGVSLSTIPAPEMPGAQAALSPRPALTADPTAEPAPREAAYVLEAEFTETTWLQVSLDGRDPVEYLFQPGERQSWKADAIELFLGNAGGAELILNGKPQPKPGLSGKTARLRFTRTP